VNDRHRFDQFTERARKVLSLAQDEAQRLNHNYIGTEHLLLGLVREGGGVAVTVLNNLGVELTKVRSAVEFIISRGDRIVLGEIGLTPRARKVIQLAVDEARRLNHHHVGTEHLLLGLVREGEGIAAGVLESLGVNLDKVRTQIPQVLSQTSQTTVRVVTSAASETRGAGPESQVHGPTRRTPPTTPPPQFRTLLRVIPIAQRQQHEGVTLTAVALEVYADGCLLTLLLERARAASDPRAPWSRLRDVTVTLTDDHDTVYAGHVQGSSGALRSDVWLERAQFAWTPSLDPAAGEIRIEIPTIQWTDADDTAPGERHGVPGAVAHGPWIFSIRLPAGGT
jgi:hypothetical protein